MGPLTSNMRSTAFIRFTVFPGRFSPLKQHHQQNLLAAWLGLDLYTTSNNSNLKTTMVYFLLRGNYGIELSLF
jgi:hypothetical protein